MKHRFIIIGMDDNRSPFFPPEALAQIRKGKVFSGGIRHKEIVGPLLPAGAEWISITVPLDCVFSHYEELAQEEPGAEIPLQKDIVWENKNSQSERWKALSVLEP